MLFPSLIVGNARSLRPTRALVTARARLTANGMTRRGKAGWIADIFQNALLPRIFASLRMVSHWINQRTGIQFLHSATVNGAVSGGPERERMTPVSVEQKFVPVPLAGVALTT